MSTTIDQRVVEMRFDNKQFEQNVNTSMSTLDKLKQKLNLSGASKGLENINAAAKNNNLSALGNAASTVASRFSAMEIMGVTALANITNSAVNAGKRMVSALTIEPVKTGFNEYELKMDSVKTIMASTGESVETVNKYLAELNEYSDQTIYSFADMTQNIGKFTNAGVELKDAVMAIKGISNEAAVSGANANEASRAMYNFAQALSAGYVKLIDWKSIENANMATKEFKQELIDTAVSMGLVTESGDGMYETLAGNSFNAIKNFNEVFQDQWMTSDVLVETLKRYADETTKIGKKAKAAAQDVTKLSQVFDIAKETAQSGWARTWELMFGDINQAKAFFTPISNAINDVLNKMSDFRNGILEGALGTPFQGLSDTFNKLSKAGKEVTSTTKDMEDAINRVLGGEFGNGQERWDKLTKAGYDWAAVQNKVNEKLGSSVRHTSKLSDAQKELETTQGLAVEQMLKMTDAQLINLGFSEEEIKAYRELEKEIAKTGHTIGEVIDNPDIMSGRNLLIEAFKNLGSAMSNVMSTAKKAWKEIFPPKAESAIERGSKGLYGIIISLHNFARRMNDLSSNKETIDKLSRTFKGLFAAIDIVTTVVAGPFKLAFKILKAILGAFNIDILDFTAILGDGIVGFRDFIKNCNFLERGIKAVIPIFSSMVDAVREWIDGMKEAENIPRYIIQGLVNGLKNGVKAVVNGVIDLGKMIIDGIKNVLGIHSPSVVFMAIGGFIIAGLLLGLKAGFPEVFATIKEFGEKCIGFLGNIDWGSVFAAGTIAGFLLVAGKFATALKNISQAFKGAGEMFERTGKGVERVLKGFGKMMSGLGFKFIAEGVKDMAISVAILVASIIALSFFDAKDLWKSVAVIAAVAAILGVLAWAMTKISDNSVSIGKDGIQLNNGLGGALLALAAAILMITFVVKMIGKMDPEQAKQGFIGLAGIIGSLLILLTAYGLVVKGKTSQNIDKLGKMLTKMAISLGILVIVAKLIANMSWGDMGKAAAGLGGFLVFVTLLMTISMIPGKNIKNIGSNILKISSVILVFIVAAKLIAGMELKDMGKAAIGLLGFLGFVALLLTISMIPGGDLDAVGKGVLKISAAILLLTITAKLIAGMEWKDMGKAAVGLLGLVGVIAVMVLVTKLAGEKTLEKLGSTLLMMAAAIGILAVVAALLGFMSIEHLAKGIIAVGLLATMMSLMIYATKDAKSCVGNIVAMTVAIAVMAAAIALLSMIDATSLLVSTGALVALMLALSAALHIAGKTGTMATSALIGLGVIALCAAALGLVITKLATLPVVGVLASAVALSALMLALSAALVILDHVGSISVSALVAVGILTLCMIGLGIALGEVTKIPVESLLPSVIALSILFGELLAATVILSAIGKFLGAGAAVQGIAALAIVIAGVGLIVAAIAGLNALFPNLEEFLATGIPILQKIGEALGAFFGGIVGGFAGGVIEGVSSSLPALGTHLSEFMTNAQPFIQGVKQVDISALEGVGVLAAAIIALTAADLVSGIASFVSGGSSFSDLGTELSAFMTNAAVFLDGIKMVDAESIEAVKHLAEAILILTAAELLDGITSFFMGESSLANFAVQLPLLGAGIVGLVESLGDVDLSKVQPAADAVKALASAAKEIPNAGGLLADLIGDNELGTFAEQFPKVGTGIRQLIESLGDVDTTKVQPAADAVVTLAKAAKQIPNAGGLLADLIGDNELGTFAIQFPKVGTGIKGLIINLGDADVSKVAPAAEAVKTMAKAAKAVPNTGGLLADLVGDNDLGTFASQFPKVGTGIKGLVTNLGDVDVSKVEPAAKAVATLAKVANDIPNSGGLLAAIVGENDLGTFAEQFPKVGTGLGGFAKNLGGGFDPNIIKTAVSAIEDLIDIGEDIEDNDGLADTENISAFGTGISNLAGYLKSFYDTISNINFDTWRTLITRINSMSTIATYDTEGLKDLGGNFVSMAYNLETGYGYIASIDMETFKNVLSSISSMSDTIASAIAVDSSGLPAQGENFSIFGSKLRSGYENISHISVSVLTRVIESFDDVVGAANGLTSVDTEGISAFSDALNELGDSVSEFVNSSSTFKSSGADIVASIADGIDSKAGILVRDIGQILEDMYKKVTDKYPSFKAGGIELMEKLIAGISGKKSEVKNAATSSLASAVSGVRGYRSNFYNAGKYLVEGFTNGIDMNMYKASAKAAAMAKAAVEAAEEALGINSPSRVFREIGNFAGLGFVNALHDYSTKTYDAGSEMADSARSGLKDSINKVLGLISGTMDVQPTIRPVLDLSGVESGMGAISGMFNSDASIGVTSHLRAIDSSMSHYGQNGGNDDLISEIRKLRGELKNAGGTTNYINGITYDDGSNISSAIETIVRAARVERRA